MDDISLFLLMPIALFSLLANVSFYSAIALSVENGETPKGLIRLGIFCVIAGLGITFVRMLGLYITGL